MNLTELIMFFFLYMTLAFSQPEDVNSRYKVVCYLGSWANYRPGDGKFVIENIDPHLCTHLIYAFAKLANNSIMPADPWLDLKDNRGLGGYQRFNNLKRINPRMSTLIAIGGGEANSTEFSVMSSNVCTRRIFIRSVVDFCRKYNFNGLDMDWEYPASRGGSQADKHNFVLLLRELQAAFRPHRLLLTAAVSAGRQTIDKAYDVPQVSRYLDFINVMAYDFHGSWERRVGHNAPLYSLPQDWIKDFNVDFGMNYWISRGAPRQKLILGMGTYGRSFTLANPNNTAIGSAATGPGRAGPFTRALGSLPYNEICLNLLRGWREVFVSRVEAPYAVSGNQWVGYDNRRSIEIKVDYLKRMNLGGGMIWSLENDDFRGKCHKGRYPLLSVIAQKLRAYSPLHTSNKTLPDLEPTDISHINFDFNKQDSL